MEPILIDSPEALFDFLDSPEKAALLASAHFGEGFNLHFKLVGESWQGKIDYRVGRFIQDLQRDILGIYNDVTGERLTLQKKYEDLEKVVVTIEVRKGSLDVLAKFDKVLTAMVQSMTGDQLMYTMLGLGVLIAGGYIFKSRTERKAKLEELKLVKDGERQDRELIARSMELVSSHSKAFTHLLSKTDADDVVYARIGGKQEEITILEAKKNLPKPVAHEPEIRSMQVWGDFMLNTLDARSYTFTLETEGIPTIRAVPSFARPEDSAVFSRKYADFMTRSEIPEMRLQLSLIINCRTRAIDTGIILKVLDEEPDGMVKIQDLDVDDLFSSDD